MSRGVLPKPLGSGRGPPRWHGFPVRPEPVMCSSRGSIEGLFQRAPLQRIAHCSCAVTCASTLSRRVPSSICRSSSAEGASMARWICSRALCVLLKRPASRRIGRMASSTVKEWSPSGRRRSSLSLLIRTTGGSILPCTESPLRDERRGSRRCLKGPPPYERP
jgi:hypothetical protein